jgi:NAD(P)-dependent dehydrogenase (short-subunit alcohol dehydrogenase family)
MAIVDFSLEGKKALVTGGSKGIGRAIALAFAEHGADVAISARGAEQLDRTCKEIEERGRRGLGLPADLSSPAEVERLHARVRDELGDLDVLVNNAGTAQGGLLSQLPREEFDRVMNVNLWAPIRLAQLCYPSMKERGGGVIVNISSNDGIRPSPFLGFYPHSKAALINVTQQMAVEWSSDGIRAVCIAPGLVRTEMAAPLVDYFEKEGKSINPLNMIAEPADIAGLALLLASPAGRFVTATTLVIDGGELASGPLSS